jgi:hypothetical protein
MDESPVCANKKPPILLKKMGFQMDPLCLARIPIQRVTSLPPAGRFERGFDVFPAQSYQNRREVSTRFLPFRSHLPVLSGLLFKHEKIQDSLDFTLL